MTIAKSPKSKRTRPTSTRQRLKRAIATAPGPEARLQHALILAAETALVAGEESLATLLERLLFAVVGASRRPLAVPTTVLKAFQKTDASEKISPRKRTDAIAQLRELIASYIAHRREAHATKKSRCEDLAFCDAESLALFARTVLNRMVPQYPYRATHSPAEIENLVRRELDGINERDDEFVNKAGRAILRGVGFAQEKAEEYWRAAYR